jgi:hypothetical protein
VFDIDLEGGINTGTAATLIHGSQAAQTVGIGQYARFPGDTVAKLWMTGVELQHVTNSGGLTVGGKDGGDIVITGVAEHNSNHITGTVTLVAKHDNAIATFSVLQSTFNALAVQADSGY